MGCRPSETVTNHNICAWTAFDSLILRLTSLGLLLCIPTDPSLYEFVEEIHSNCSGKCSILHQSEENSCAEADLYPPPLKHMTWHINISKYIKIYQPTRLGICRAHNTRQNPCRPPPPQYTYIKARKTAAAKADLYPLLSNTHHMHINQPGSASGALATQGDTHAARSLRTSAAKADLYLLSHTHHMHKTNQDRHLLCSQHKAIPLPTPPFPSPQQQKNIMHVADTDI